VVATSIPSRSSAEVEETRRYGPPQHGIPVMPGCAIQQVSANLTPPQHVSDVAMFDQHNGAVPPQQVSEPGLPAQHERAGGMHQHGMWSIGGKPAQQVSWRPSAAWAAAQHVSDALVRIPAGGVPPCAGSSIASISTLSHQSLTCLRNAL